MYLGFYSLVLKDNQERWSYSAVIGGLRDLLANNSKVVTHSCDRIFVCFGVLEGSLLSYYNVHIYADLCKLSFCFFLKSV